jgi:hypothetical protein
MELTGKTIQTVILPRLVILVDKGMRWLASSLLRIFIVTIAVLITAYLLYTNVWENLLNSVALPAGVSSENIKLNTELLKSINDQRISRVEHQAQPFALDVIFQTGITRPQ